MFRRVCCAVLIFVASSTVCWGQFPRPLGRGGFSFRSPMLDIDVGAYGGMRMRGPAYLPPPPLGFGFPPLPPPPLRGSRVDIVVPLPQLDYSALRPALVVPPVTAPRFDVPSYDEVFPERQREAVVGDPHNGAFDSLLPAALALRSQLSVREDGDVWIEYLEVDSIIELAREVSGSARLDALERDNDPTTAARRLLVPFDAVAASRDLGWIAATESFQTVRASLRGLTGDDSSPTSQIEFPSEAPQPTPLPADPVERLEELPLPAPDTGNVNPAGPVYRGEA